MIFVIGLIVGVCLGSFVATAMYLKKLTRATTLIGNVMNLERLQEDLKTYRKLMNKHPNVLHYTEEIMEITTKISNIKEKLEKNE